MENKELKKVLYFVGRDLASLYQENVKNYYDNFEKAYDIGINCWKMREFFIFRCESGKVVPLQVHDIH